MDLWKYVEANSIDNQLFWKFEYKYKIFSINANHNATNIVYKTQFCTVFIFKTLDCKKLKCFDASSINATNK